MKYPDIDLIQVFCSNFKCDIDLRQPVGTNRYIRDVIWPSFEDAEKFSKLNRFDKLIQIQKLEILLKISRYSIETLNIVLGSSQRFPHLELAVKDHYSKSDISDNFHAKEMILALQVLNLISLDVNEEELIHIAEQKFSN
jgi:predicted HD phosphohydrolase